MRAPYIGTDGDPMSLMPRLSLSLSHGDRTIDVIGLLDSGSAVNVLPYHVGLELGARWEDQATPVPLVGTLGRHDARALILMASHPEITGNSPVRLVFAWTQSEDVPVLFGQMNFFLEFDVCFYRSEAEFEVTRRKF
jgi:hypothetical protein